MPQANPLRITVARDWDRCKRGVLWEEVLAELPDVQVELRQFGVGDEPEMLASGTIKDLLLHHIHGSDVLVINWDSANGDPDFGGDFAMRWFEHRRLEVLAWVARGGVLIIEGQATLGVPTQRAYDSIVGPGEVALCGAEDPQRPELQHRRYGFECRLTRRASKSDMFAGFGVREIESRSTERAYDEMLPGVAAWVVAPHLRTLQWNMLYRGWFRTNPFRGRRLRWVSLLVTADRRWWMGRFNHSVLLGAAHGKGSIIVSTMFLASAGQHELIGYLLKCGGRVPARGGLVRPTADFLRKNAVPVFTGLVAAPIVAAAGRLDATGALAKLAQALAALIGFVLVGLLARALRGLVNLVKEILGY